MKASYKCSNTFERLRTAQQLVCEVIHGSGDQQVVVMRIDNRKGQPRSGRSDDESGAENVRP